MYFVSGITGHVGGAVARYLLRAGHKVRALVRSVEASAQWAQPGVELRQGDLNVAGDVAAALADVEGAFLMLPPQLAPSPDYAEARQTITSYVAALRQAPPPRVVALSAVGSEQPRGLGNITTTHLFEQALADSPVPIAFLRPGSFLENYAGGLGHAAQTGFFDTLLTPPDRPVPMAATDDIGREAATLLERGFSGRPIVEVGTRLSANDLAEAMSKVLGKSITARSIPREHWAAVVQSFGLPSGRTGPYEEMFESFNSGWIDFGAPGAISAGAQVTPAQVFAAAHARGASASH